MSDNPDQELEQLYAARYRDSFFAGSPITRDSLENSSDGANSLKSSIISQKPRFQIGLHFQNSGIAGQIIKFEEQGRARPSDQIGGLLKIANDRNGWAANGNSVTHEPPSGNINEDAVHHVNEIHKQHETPLNQVKNIRQQCQYSPIVLSKHQKEQMNAHYHGGQVSERESASRNDSKGSSPQVPRNQDVMVENIGISHAKEHVPQKLQTNDTHQKSFRESGNSEQATQNLVSDPKGHSSHATHSTDMISALFARTNEVARKYTETRTESPVSSAIKNLLAYQKLQENNKNASQKQHGPVDRNTVKDVESPPPSLPPRKPASLLRVVTEQKFLENSNLSGSPIAHKQKVEDFSSKGRESPSQPYFYGQTKVAPEVDSSRISSQNKSPRASPRVRTPIEYGRLAVKTTIEDNRLETPSPRTKVELLDAERNNPAGLLAYVTRDTNSPLIQRRITGLIKTGTARNSVISSSKHHSDILYIQNELSVKSPDPEESEIKNPVKVLPSNLNSQEASEIFRNFQRPSTEREGIVYRSNEQQQQQQNSPANENVEQIGKEKSSPILVQPNKHEIRSPKYPIQPDKSSQITEKRRNRSPPLPNPQKEKTLRDNYFPGNHNYQAFVNESSDELSSRSSFECECSENSPNQKLLSPISWGKLAEEKNNKNPQTRETTYRKSTEDKKKEKEDNEKFWTFTTSVVFPKCKCTMKEYLLLFSMISDISSNIIFNISSLM